MSKWNEGILRPHWSTRLWSQEVAAIEAQTKVDLPGNISSGVAALSAIPEPSYEFSNGRRFSEKTDPYA